MAFQDQEGIIKWKVHFASPIEKVFNALTTDEGRSKFWAEKTKEENGFIEFHILNYPTYISQILNKTPPYQFRLLYFGTDVTFDLTKTEENETDLNLSAIVPNNEAKFEMTAGWVSVLMAMKGAIDFGIDLRNHDPDRVWENGFLDN